MSHIKTFLYETYKKYVVGFGFRSSSFTANYMEILLKTFLSLLPDNLHDKSKTSFVQWPLEELFLL